MEHVVHPSPTLLNFVVENVSHIQKWEMHSCSSPICYREPINRIEYDITIQISALQHLCVCVCVVQTKPGTLRA